MTTFILAALISLEFSRALPENVAAVVPDKNTRTSEVLSKLGSSTASERAWGAFTASALQLRSAAPSLLALLEAIAQSDDVDPHERAAVIDALLSLEVVPPPHTLELLMAQEAPSAGVLLLMLRAPAANRESLLAIVRADKGSTAHWFAATRALVELGSREAVEEAYRRIKLTAHVHVASQASGIFSGSVGGTIGDRFPSKWPVEYPPQAVYAIELRCGRDQCVDYSTRSWTGPVSGVSHSYRDHHVLTYAEVARKVLRYLPHLSADSDLDPLLNPAPHHYLTFQQPSQFEAKIQELEAPLRQAYATLGDELVERSLLRRENVRPLSIEWCVSDERMNRKNPLPRLTAEHCPSEEQ